MNSRDQLPPYFNTQLDGKGKEEPIKLEKFPKKLKIKKKGKGKRSTNATNSPTFKLDKIWITGAPYVHVLFVF